ncbi:MAG TPA: DsbA family protein [Propionicimonas sp.]|uniref:DsbA family oxidoreductase n=1 Tax=Propionicimonas sp. TaxID=1955623 RepID=UPI002F3EC207
MTIEITAFTDPVCTWCWGSEPVLRAVKERYGDQVRITPVMGGLVKDIREFMDARNGIGGDPDGANRNVARHYGEASARHGMPVQTEGFALFSDGYPSTYPQNEAYLAAKQQGTAIAATFLRRIREASAAEARQTNRPEVLAELAAEVGLDVGAFLTALGDGTAKKAFADDLATTAAYGVRGFPSFVVDGGDDSRPLMLPSYQPYATFREVIRLVSNGTAVEATLPKDAEAIAGFIRRWGSAADIEITTTFELTTAEWAELAPQVEAIEDITVVATGNGRFFHADARAAGTCDLTTGVCG